MAARWREVGAESLRRRADLTRHDSISGPSQATLCFHLRLLVEDWDAELLDCEARADRGPGACLSCIQATPKCDQEATTVGVTGASCVDDSRWHRGDGIDLSSSRRHER